MRLLLDADGVIKLHRAGLLNLVIGTFSCTVPEPVFDEVVTKAKARLHRDADAIEAILAESDAVRPAGPQQQVESGLGAGELGVLTVLASDQEAIVVSDDRRFLAVLKARGARSITPADLLTVLWRRDVLSTDEAKGALERLRPMIRSAAYWEARDELSREVKKK